jgi:hypothetical protein
MVGVLAAKVAVPVEHIVCGLPAFAVVGVAFTVIVTLLDEAVHVPFEIVQVKT